MIRPLLFASTALLFVLPAHAATIPLEGVIQDINYLEWISDGVWCPQEGSLPLTPYIPPVVNDPAPLPFYVPPSSPPATPVPEPSTWALIGMGAAAIGWLKWRRA